jgi:succinoglycan biosynthesis transport protein ExoP
MSFNQLLTVLRARWALVLSIFLVVVALTVTGTLLMPKRYTATASVIIDIKSPDPIAGMVLPGLMAPGYIATQLDILQSDRVVRKVIKALKLDESPDLRQQWQESAKGEGDFEGWLVPLLSRGLEIKPSKESSAIFIGYSSGEPKFAAALANAFMHSYIDTTLELRVEPAKRYSGLFNEQVQQARAAVEAAQSRLSTMQKEHGIVASDERLDAETGILNELSGQLVAVQGMKAESTGRQRNSGANSPDVVNSPLIAGLKTDLSRQEARLKEISSRFGPEHPQYQELMANINEIRSRIDTETARIASSATISTSINSSREAEIRGAIEAQRQKLLRLKEQRDQVAVLARDVDSAQRAYDSTYARYFQSNIESQSNQTNVSVLAEARPPMAPSSPKTFVNIVLGILTGGMLALAVALIVELRDRRMRNEDDVTQGLELPLLGVLPLANTKSGPLRLPDAGRRPSRLALPFAGKQ